MRLHTTHLNAPTWTATAGLIAALATALVLSGCRTRPPGAPANTTSQVPVEPSAAGTPAGAVGAAATGGSGLAAEAVTTAVALATQQAAKLQPSLAFTFGTAGTEPGQIQLPFDIAVDGQGYMYVSDSTGVQRFDGQGNFVSRIGSGELMRAQGIATRPDGTLYVTGDGPQVKIYGPDGKLTGTLGNPGTSPGQLQDPVDVALDRQGNAYVVDARNGRVEIYGPDGQHRQTVGERGEGRGQFSSPRAIAVDQAGRIYVGMGDDFLIQRFGPDGKYIDSFGKAHADETMWRTGGLAIDDTGRLYATQSISHAVQCFDTGQKAALRWEYGSLGSDPNQLNSPTGLATSGERLYIADTNNNRIQVLNLTP
jgi:sugar lactone lactonase YvrE